MKENAFLLLKVAASLFPPLDKIIGEALSNIADNHPDRALVDEVREALPSLSPIDDAIKTVEQQR